MKSLLSAAELPAYHTVMQYNGMHSMAVEGGQQICVERLLFPHHSQEVQMLLCFLDIGCDVNRPGDVVRYVGSITRLKSKEPLHTCTLPSSKPTIHTLPAKIQILVADGKRWKILTFDKIMD